MPNASDYSGLKPAQILALGDTGSGKTTQFLTLPGKKFAYLFDPNAIRSLRGHDVTYEEFLPDRINLSVTSLSKTVGGDKTTQFKSDLYLQWEKDFDEKLSRGFFDQFQNIGFDSATTLLDLVMDRILTINGRYGQWPQQDDYGPQMVTFMNICRQLTAMGKTVYMTGHFDTRQDAVTKKVSTRPMMTGRLVTKIPLLFSEVLAFSSSIDSNGKSSYRVQTMPDHEIKCVRTSLRGLQPFENVTIDWTKPVEGQGLGGILLRDVANRASK